jgi:septin 7
LRLSNGHPGESGLGKSTLVNTLFNTSLYPPKERKGPSLDIIPKTVTIQSISADIEEAGVRLRLTVVDTPGFGDFVNNDESWRPIVDNIEQRFDAYLDAENKVNRMNIVDNRIHACVFFIQPTGHSLKPLDIEVMKRLHTKVNLIPVIAKADTLTDDEVAAFKARVSAERGSPYEIEANNISLDPCGYQISQGPNLRGSPLRAR